MNRVKQLRYGSVIQLIEIDKEKVTTINETYFFMERIDKNEIFYLRRKFNSYYN